EVVRLRRRSKTRRQRDIARRAHARDRHRLDVIRVASRHLGGDGARTDGIDVDAVLTAVLGYPLRESDHATLGQCVRRPAARRLSTLRWARHRAAQLARDGADVDDLAAALALHDL